MGKIDRSIGFEDRARGKAVAGGPLSSVDVGPDQWDPNGLGNAQVDGQQSGRNAYDDSVDRYRQQARAAQAGTAPVTLDQTNATQTRGMEMGALGLLRQQAMGTAPSAAVIQSQRANENAAAGAAQATARTHGIGARIATAGTAGQQGANTALAANAQNAGARAAETSAGMNAYGQGTGVVNQQDLGAATTNAGLAMSQRQLDQQRQEYYDQLAYDTRRAQAANSATYGRLANSQRAAQTQANMADEATARQLVGFGVSALTAAGGGAMSAAGNAANQAGSDPNQSGSDPRMKQDIRPIVGSLSVLKRGGR